MNLDALQHAFEASAAAQSEPRRAALNALLEHGLFWRIRVGDRRAFWHESEPRAGAAEDRLEDRLRSTGEVFRLGR